MINVLIKKDGKKVTCLEIKGHAHSDEYGKDLVCAGVSAIITGGLNNLHDLDNYEILFEEGHVKLKVLEDISAHDEVVIETIITSLQTVEESNKKFVKIQIL